jgi:hypothetical protein
MKWQLSGLASASCRRSRHPDRHQLVSFAFAVGTPIPKAEWESHNLLADDSSSD